MELDDILTNLTREEKIEHLSEIFSTMIVKNAIRLFDKPWRQKIPDETKFIKYVVAFEDWTFTKAMTKIKFPEWREILIRTRFHVRDLISEVTMKYRLMQDCKPRAIREEELQEVMRDLCIKLEAQYQAPNFGIGNKLGIGEIMCKECFGGSRDAEDAMFFADIFPVEIKLYKDALMEIFETLKEPE